MADGQIDLSPSRAVLDLSPVAGERGDDSRSGSFSPPQGQPVESAPSEAASLARAVTDDVSSIHLPPATEYGDSLDYPGGAASELTGEIMAASAVLLPPWRQSFGT
jgi:hypothetical protein